MTCVSRQVPILNPGCWCNTTNLTTINFWFLTWLIALTALKWYIALIDRFSYCTTQGYTVCYMLDIGIVTMVCLRVSRFRSCQSERIYQMRTGCNRLSLCVARPTVLRWTWDGFGGEATAGATVLVLLQPIETKLWPKTTNSQTNHCYKPPHGCMFSQFDFLPIRAVDLRLTYMPLNTNVPTSTFIQVCKNTHTCGNTGSAQTPITTPLYCISKQDKDWQSCVLLLMPYLVPRGSHGPLMDEDRIYWDWYPKAIFIYVGPQVNHTDRKRNCLMKLKLKRSCLKLVDVGIIIIHVCKWSHNYKKYKTARLSHY